MLLQVGVKVLLKNTEGKFLLVRRNPKKYPEVGAEWEIPGGRIDPGSTLLDNLKREVMEETGLVLSSPVKLVAAQDILREDRHVVRLTYTGTIDGNPKIDEEHTEYKWFSGEDIKNLGEIDKYFKELVLSSQIIL
jgi:8-oxo-dGTP diphosphatase